MNKLPLLCLALIGLRCLWSVWASAEHETRIRDQLEAVLNDPAIRYNTPMANENPKGCPFCRQSVIESQSLFETEQTRVFINLSPKSEGHCLIVPKRHVHRLEDLNPQEFLEIQEACQKLQPALRELFGAEDFLVIQQNGRQTGQSQYHLHVHVVPRVKHDQKAKVELWEHFLADSTGNAQANRLSTDDLSRLVKRFQDYFR